MKTLLVPGLGYSSPENWTLCRDLFEVSDHGQQSVRLVVLDSRQCTLTRQYHRAGGVAEERKYNLIVNYFGLLSIRYRQESDASLWCVEYIDELDPYFKVVENKFFVTYNVPGSFDDMFVNSDNKPFSDLCSSFMSESATYVVAFVADMYRG